MSDKDFGDLIIMLRGVLPAPQRKAFDSIVQEYDTRLSAMTLDAAMLRQRVHDLKAAALVPPELAAMILEEMEARE